VLQRAEEVQAVQKGSSCSGIRLQKRTIDSKRWKKVRIEQLLKKLDHLMKAKIVDRIFFSGKGSNKVFQISSNELEKMRKPMSAGGTKQSGKSMILGNFVNLAQTKKGIQIKLLQMKFLAQIGY
jgi:hypothetical protein